MTHSASPRALTPERPFHGGKPKTKTARLDVVFLCNACGKKLSDPLTAEGKSVPCPTCGSRMTVPPRDPQRSTGEEPDAVNARKPGEIKFFCVRCGQSLAIDRERPCLLCAEKTAETCRRRLLAEVIVGRKAEPPTHL